MLKMIQQIFSYQLIQKGWMRLVLVSMISIQIGIGSGFVYAGPEMTAPGPNDPPPPPKPKPRPTVEVDVQGRQGQKLIDVSNMFGAAGVATGLMNKQKQKARADKRKAQKAKLKAQRARAKATFFEAQIPGTDKYGRLSKDGTHFVDEFGRELADKDGKPIKPDPNGRVYERVPGKNPKQVGSVQTMQEHYRSTGSSFEGGTSRGVSSSGGHTAGGGTSRVSAHPQFDDLFEHRIPKDASPEKLQLHRDLHAEAERSLSRSYAEIDEHIGKSNLTTAQGKNWDNLGVSKSTIKEMDNANLKILKAEARLEYAKSSLMKDAGQGLRGARDSVPGLRHRTEGGLQTIMEDYKHNENVSRIQKEVDALKVEREKIRAKAQTEARIYNQNRIGNHLQEVSEGRVGFKDGVQEQLKNGKEPTILSEKVPVPQTEAKAPAADTPHNAAPVEAKTAPHNPAGTQGHPAPPPPPAHAPPATTAHAPGVPQAPPANAAHAPTVPHAPGVPPAPPVQEGSLDDIIKRNRDLSLPENINLDDVSRSLAEAENPNIKKLEDELKSNEKKFKQSNDRIAKHTETLERLNADYKELKSKEFRPESELRDELKNKSLSKEARQEAVKELEESRKKAALERRIEETRGKLSEARHDAKLAAKTDKQIKLELNEAKANPHSIPKAQSPVRNGFLSDEDRLKSEEKKALAETDAKDAKNAAQLKEEELKKQQARVEEPGISEQEKQARERRRNKLQTELDQARELESKADKKAKATDVSHNERLKTDSTLKTDRLNELNEQSEAARQKAAEARKRAITAENKAEVAKASGKTGEYESFKREAEASHRKANQLRSQYESLSSEAKLAEAERLKADSRVARANASGIVEENLKFKQTGQVPEVVERSRAMSESVHVQPEAPALTEAPVTPAEHPVTSPAGDLAEGKGGVSAGVDDVGRAANSSPARNAASEFHPNTNTVGKLAASEKQGWVKSGCALNFGIFAAQLACRGAAHGKLRDSKRTSCQNVLSLATSLRSEELRSGAVAIQTREQRGNGPSNSQSNSNDPNNPNSNNPNGRVNGQNGQNGGGNGRDRFGGGLPNLNTGAATAAENAALNSLGGLQSIFPDSKEFAKAVNQSGLPAAIANQFPGPAGGGLANMVQALTPEVDKLASTLGFGPELLNPPMSTPAHAPVYSLGAGSGSAKAEGAPNSPHLGSFNFGNHNNRQVAQETSFAPRVFDIWHSQSDMNLFQIVSEKIKVVSPRIHIPQQE